MEREKSWRRRLLWVGVCCLLAMQLALAQGKSGIRMSINKTDVQIEEILDDVKKETGWKVFYNSALVKGVKATVKLEHATVDEILNAAFRGTRLTYRIEEGTIVVRERKPEEGGEVQDAQPHERIVRGKVLDEQGALLVGAAIRMEGTQMGTVTDTDGAFTLKVPTGVNHLEVSFVGMKKKMLALGRKEFYVVNLQEDNVLLDDVVATGYQTISKERATGAYDILKGDEVEKRHATNFSSILDGLVAGAQGTDDGRGGISYQIRGTGTMMADQMPLVVVDGFPLMDIASSGADQNPALSALEKINPNDVESVTILKDAAAASIWGARSANGVIVITTKKGAKKKQWEVSINTQLSVGQKADVDQLLNLVGSADMIAYQRMAFERGWFSDEYYGTLGELTHPVTASELLLYQGMRWGTISREEMDKGLERLAQLDNRKQIKKYFLKNPLVFQTNASLSGGTEHYSTHLSLFYQHDSGDFIGKRENSFMANWNNQYDFNRWISLQVGLNLQQENAHASYVTSSDLRNLSPYEMLLNEDGSYASHVGSYNTDVLGMYDWSRFANHDMNYNLLQEARTRNRRTTNTSYRAQVGLQVNIIEGLRFNSKFQYEENRYNQRTYHSAESFHSRFQVNYYTPCDYNGNPEGESVLPVGGILQPSHGKRRGTVFRNDFSFDRTFGGRHVVSAVLGNELSNYRYHSYVSPYLYGCTSATSGGTVGPSGYFGTLDGYSSTVNGVSSEGREYLSETQNNNRYVSFYGNASYMYDERYGLSLSARSDASNLITSEPKYRWSPLWSVGAIWHVSNEAFLKSVSWLNRLTLRLTYGQNGNACSTLSARTTVSVDTSWPDESTGLHFGTISDYGNPTLRWEKTATTNIGIDFSLLDDHLYGSVDFYDKKGTDILGNVTISAVNGTSNAIFNNAELRNRGLEVSLGGRIDAGEFSFSGNVTYAYNKNEITSLYNELTTASDLLNASYVVGKPLQPIYTFEYAGLNAEGMPCISDGHGGTYGIDDFSVWYSSDRTMLKYMGTAVSPHTLGVSLSAEWKGFRLSTLFNGRFGGRMRMPSFNYPTVSSWSKMVLSGELGDVLAGAADCLPLPGEEITPEQYSYWPYYYNCLDIRVEDASYIYCKEVVLDYDFPQFTPASRILKGLGLFCKVENLGLLWSANSKHYHPEYLPGSVAAPALTYTLEPV